MTITSFILFYFLLSFVSIALSEVYVYDYSNKFIANLVDEPAGFGPSFPSAGLKGYITTTNPANGCKKLLPPPNLPVKLYPWIALIPRTHGFDTCEFAVKIQNAQDANYSAVIIYNYEDKIITMGSSGKSVRIPSTLVTRTSGVKLISQYLYNNTFNGTPAYYVKLSPEPSISMLAYLIPIIAVITLSLFIIIGVVLIKIYLQRRRTTRNRLPRSALKQLRTKRFDKGDPWEVCAICLDDYEEGAKLRILPCDHAYHMKCIDPWLINSRRQCPVCKRYVFPHENNSDGEENIGHQQSRTPTEQTPLVNSNDNDSTVEVLSTRPLLSERRLVNPSGRGVHNASFAPDETSINDANIFSSSPSASEAAAITTGPIFNRRSATSRRYGSTHDSSTMAHSTTRSVGSISDARDNPNISSLSILEDVSDNESINGDNKEDEAIHPSILV